MTMFFRVAISAMLLFVLSTNLIAQDKGKKDEQFNKIVKLAGSKKPEDQDKTYLQSKEFLTKFGAEATDEKVKKIQEFVDNIELNKFNDYLNAGKSNEAFLLGKELLERQPENSYITMNLAYGGYEAFSKKNDDSFGGDSIGFAEKTLKLFEAGKLPKTFAPIKDQAEASALMHYIIGTFSIDFNPKDAAINFLKATKFESQYKTSSVLFYQIAAYYEKVYETAAKEFSVNHGLKNTEDAAMKADNAKLNILLDRMIDAYARTVKYAEAEKSPNFEAWKTRLTQIYTFRKKSATGLPEMLNSILNTPIPEIL